MSHGIQKETYVEADAKTTKALTFDLLDKLYQLAEGLETAHINHLHACDGRFKRLEDRKRRDTVVASASGVGGGFLAIGAYYLRQWFGL